MLTHQIKEAKLNINSNDLKDILAHALATIKEKMGESYSIEKVNLAELHRITGISRAKLRRLKKNGSIQYFWSKLALF